MNKIKTIVVAVLVAVLSPLAAGSALAYEAGDRWTYRVIKGVHCRVVDSTTDPATGVETVEISCSYQNYKEAGTGTALVYPDGTVTYEDGWYWWVVGG